jgi:hypothetical protein
MPKNHPLTLQKSLFYKAADFFEGSFLDPDFSAGSTNERGDILEKIKVPITLFLMGNGGLAGLVATDSAKLFVFVAHGVFCFLVHGSSHLLGSIQWAVMM